MHASLQRRLPTPSIDHACVFPCWMKMIKERLSAALGATDLDKIVWSNLGHPGDSVVTVFQFPNAIMAEAFDRVAPGTWDEAVAAEQAAWEARQPLVAAVRRRYAEVVLL